MSKQANHPVRRERLLDGYTLIAEVLFGLIMVLTFTGSLSVAPANRGRAYKCVAFVTQSGQP